MLAEIKDKLRNNPQYIIDLLERFEFYNITLKGNEIRCGFDEQSNRTSIRLKLTNNYHLFVKDYARDKSYDLVTYIIKVRNVSYAEVMNEIKSILGIEDMYFVNQQRTIFGGFYKNIRKQRGEYQNKIYDDTLLNQYSNIANARFTRDKIDIDTQKHFHIGLDITSQRITIPIRDAFGNLIGVKGRINYDSETEPKYLYLVPCKMSCTLYGYSENYEYLSNNTVYVYEAEKSVMQSYAYGLRNAVALGSNSLSETQAKLLVELNPQRVVFMLDEGLDMEITHKNIEILKRFAGIFHTIEIGYWNYTKNKYEAKISPTDLGKVELQRIIDNEIEYEVQNETTA